ncbi:MAG: glycoside hydrolase family 127 protein [Planctomycetes bacterium]|nr:glycoside hydrolase family 127 protein [Planctomycetota bacterium]
MSRAKTHAEGFAGMNQGWKPGDRIGYIRRDIPRVTLPPYEGRRYETTVPDTLDLAERARLAVNALTECTDSLADYEIYPIVVFQSKPPQMIHQCWQTSLFGKFIMALNLARLMSGSEQNLHVEQGWLETALKMQGPDGLVYTPLNGRPWAYDWYPPAALEDSLSRALAQGGQELSPFGTATLLGGLSVVARRSHEPFWTDAVRRLADALVSLMVQKEDIAYVWPSVMIADRHAPEGATAPTIPFECEGSIIPHALVQAYKMTGYEAALSAAGRYLNYLRRHFFGQEGAFHSSAGRLEMAHFHAHARTLLAMIEYAEATGDARDIPFVLASYEWAKGLLADQGIDASYRVSRAPGAALLGFFPEWTQVYASEMHGETCQATDMIAMALRLGEAGWADTWDDADRWIRNHLAESQFVRTDWIHSIQGVPGAKLGPYGSTDRVAERIVGAFAGSQNPNDLYSGDHAHGIGHCCTANGAKVLYWAWERILRFRDGKLRVNLLMNRASPWADVDSYIPFEGRVDIRVKHASDLSIRIPEWVSPAETRCKVNGGDRSLSWQGRYAEVGAVQSGDLATLTFPISERVSRVSIEKRRYTLVRKGNDVVSIQPGGRHCPLYQRQHYRANEPQYSKVTRFVSDHLIET